MRLLLVGATGLVGRHVLALALSDPRIGAVVAPVRRDLPAHPKLLAPVVDFEQLLPHLSSLHPSRYGALVDDVPLVGLVGVRPVTDQSAAMFD